MLNVLYTNIDQLLNKRDDLGLAIAGNEHHARLTVANMLTSLLDLPTSIYNFDPNAAINVAIDVATSPSIRGFGICVSKKLPFCEVKYIVPAISWIKITLRGHQILYWLAAFIAVHHLTHTKALLNCVIY